MKEEILNKIISTAKKYNIKRLYLFGSAAETDSYRDIDLASEGISGWDLFRFAGDLENELIVNVDVVELENETSFTKAITPKLKLLYEQ
jgi:predicted nucleotidyltransferase